MGVLSNIGPHLFAMTEGTCTFIVTTGCTRLSLCESAGSDSPPSSEVTKRPLPCLGVLGAEACGDPRLLEVGLRDHWLNNNAKGPGNHNVAYQLCVTPQFCLCHAARGRVGKLSDDFRKILPGASSCALSLVFRLGHYKV